MPPPHFFPYVLFTVVLIRHEQCKVLIRNETVGATAFVPSIVEVTRTIRMKLIIYV